MIRRRTLVRLRADLARVTRHRDSLAVQASSYRGRVAVLEAELATRPEPFVIVVDGQAAVDDTLAGIERVLGGEPA